MENLLMSWGLRYLKAGWSIIPIQTKSKLPLIDWKEFQTRRASEAELRSWLQKWPEMNVGLVTGPISSLAVVDLDGLEGMSFGRQKRLASGVTSKTGSGRHLFYRWMGGLRNSASKIAEGVDIRGEGGYVVVAPSTHPFGRSYRWERFVPALIPDFPTGLLSAISTASIPQTPISFTKPDDWLSEALEEMKNGHVHNTLVSVLGKFRAHNFSISDTVRRLQPHCLEDGKPFQGLEDKVREIWGRYPSGTISSGARASEGYSPYDIRSNTGLSIKSPTNDNDFEQFQLCLQPNNGRNGSVLSSGFPTLDRFCEGGLKSERLFTIAARTGTGKTNFSIALARNLCEQGKKVLFFLQSFNTQKSGLDIWQHSQISHYFNNTLSMWSTHLAQILAKLKKHSNR